MIKKAALAGLVVVTTTAADAAPVDFSSWSAVALNFPGGQPAANWSRQSGNTVVLQTVNADPSFFLNNRNQTRYSVNGSWEVTTSSDNDFMGFVFGYQNSSNFYLFDWKQGTQNNTYGSNAAEGMTIKKYAGATGNGLVDLSLGEFWENNVDKGAMTIIDTNHGSTTGWADGTLYDFHLQFNRNPGEHQLVIREGATTLWDVTFNDMMFPSGQFGFYNFSQENVRYSSFEIDPVPVPAALPLFGAAMVVLGYIGWRKRKVT